jgi:cell division protease FtsH
MKNRSVLLVVALVVGLTALGSAAAVFGPHEDPGAATSLTAIHGSGAPAPADHPEVTTDSYSNFVLATESGDVRAVSVDSTMHEARVQYSDGRIADVTLPSQSGGLLRQLAEDGVLVRIDSPSSAEPAGGGLLAALLPMLLIFGLVALSMVYLRRRAAKSGGGGMGPDMSLRSSVMLEQAPRERFEDVAGCDEAVEELAEIVEFFHDPTRFERLGARPPSGVMLHGDPGTGKTLLAKALAGEAGVPFYAASGSDFVEKFVGVGASRVRQLFDKARRHEEGAVVFIDEIDAVGRSRHSSDGNGEREQTLNQILVELDGFSTSDKIICIAATNRLDVLDPALLRPGRFGRHIAVPLPAADGRSAILALHAAGRPVSSDVSLPDLAATMGGLSGAQLADVVNEAAVMAAREDAASIGREHFREGYLRVLAGPKRRNAPLADGEVEVIACHEAGHVLCAEHGERYEKAQQVTIEPRGRAMGLAVYGQSDRALHDPEYVHEALVATLGGRAAEQIVFNRISSGAANDLQKATELARRAVEELGFSARLGQIVAGRAPFSEATRAVVDREIERMVADAYADARSILAAHRDQLDRLSTRLVEHRVLERVDILAAIGPAAPRRPAAPQTAPRPTRGAAPHGLPLAAASPDGDPA